MKAIAMDSAQATSPLTTDTAFNCLSFLWLELTEKCNLECVHCYADSRPSKDLSGRMTYEDWMRLLTDARDLKCESVQFIGGEVLLVPFLETLLSDTHSLGFEKVEVFTNATKLSASQLTAFSRYGVSVATSFYSFDPETHDRITSRRGSWRRTLSTLERLKAHCIPLRIGVIEMDHNRGHIPATLDFLTAHGFSTVGVDQMRSVGRGATLRPAADSFTELCGRCGNRRLCVTASGAIYPCIMARSFKLGNYLAHDSLEDILSGAHLSRFSLTLAKAKEGHASNPHDSPFGACSPGCWPNGGCAPHDICVPDKKNELLQSGHLSGYKA